jgi:hypothetical protein
VSNIERKILVQEKDSSYTFDEGRSVTFADRANGKGHDSQQGIEDNLSAFEVKVAIR